MADLNDLMRRYLALYSQERVGDGDLERIENALEITLPVDFRDICQFFSGGILSGLTFLDIAPRGRPLGVVDRTLNMRRERGIGPEFICLAEFDESAIFLMCGDLHGQPAVVWCDHEDVRHLGDVAAMTEPDVWRSYGDFFKALLDDE